MNKVISERSHSKQTFNDLGVAMERYYEITGSRLSPLKTPRLSDFYNPSRQRKDAEIALIIGGMTLIGVVAYNM